MTTTIRKKRQDDTRQDLALLTDQDVYLFREGSHVRLYEKLGAHPGTLNGVDGTHFAVWAPNAAAVSVIGDFNGWDVDANHLRARQDESGIWEGFVAGVGTQGALSLPHRLSAGRPRGPEMRSLRLCDGSTAR